MLSKIPAGLDEIIHTYGHPTMPGFEIRMIVTFELPYPLVYAGQPVHLARCHKLVVDNFVTAFRNVMAAGMVDQFTEFEGIYARRAIRGQPSHPSLHSWGVAIDMCASRYPLGSSRRMPSEIVNAFERAGFFYGANFKSRKDPMHFQLATHY